MSRKLADRLSSIAPSATLAMGARAAKLRAEGHRVFPFGVGEPDFDTPSLVRNAAKAALDAGATHYTAVSGTAELKSAICAATERYRGYRPSPSEIVVSCGAKHVLFNLAYRHEDSPAPSYTGGPTPVTYAKTKSDMFAGMQLSLGRHLIVGMNYNYFLLREMSFSASLFF